MPIKKSAWKALRQSEKKAVRNIRLKKKIKELVKDSQKLIGIKEKTAVDKVKDAIKAIDKAVQKKIVKKNFGARKKSRLMKKLNLVK
ncbi:MAG: 30S ribosomal protein S20 [bacterium]